MESAIDLCARAADAVAAVDLGSLTREQLSSAAVGLTRHLDRMKALHAAVLREANRAGVWRGTGARNLADWLAAETATGYGELVGRARLGDALDAAPSLADAVASGEVSAATAEALADAVTSPPEGASVDELVDAVKGATPSAARSAVEKWKELASTESPEDAEARRYRRRSVTFSRPDDGMVTATAVLSQLDAGQFRRVLSAIAGKPCEADDRTTEQRLADGLIQLVAAYGKGDVKGGRENTSMLITGSAETWAGLSDAPGRTAEGDSVPAHVLRRLAEDARVQRVIAAGDEVLRLGRSVRFASDAQWRALVVRDQCCRWAGCHLPAAWCDVDHLVPWEAGGLTELSNLVLWCRHHHLEKHRPGVKVLGNAHDLTLQLANGTLVDCSLRQRQAAA